MAPQVDLLTAKIFVAVVEEESVARAAEREGISPATVGKRLRELEDGLGIALLHRQGGGVELTPAGATLLRRARAMLYEADELERELRLHALGQGKPIRLYASESAVFGALPDLLCRFLDACPDAKVDVIEAMGNEVVRAVEQGAADLGVFVGVAPTSGLVVHTCYRDRLVVVVPPDHPLAGSRTLRIAEVLAHDIIGPDRRGSIGAAVVRAAADLGLAPRIRLRVDGLDTVCRLVKLGIGVGLISAPHFEYLGRAMGLVAVPLAESWASRTFRVCARDPRLLSSGARRLLDAMVAEGERTG